MVPRVLAVVRDPQLDGVELTVAPDGDDALARLRRQPFDALVVDLALPPLDGWCLLAAVGGWTERPRLIARVAAPGEVGRATALGADLCVAPGTPVHARALQRSTKEMHKETACPQPLATNSRRPTTTGVRA